MTKDFIPSLEDEVLAGTSGAETTADGAATSPAGGAIKRHGGGEHETQVS